MKIEEINELLWDKRGAEKARYNYVCRVQGLFSNFQNLSYKKKENAEELFKLIKPWYLYKVGTTEYTLAENIYEHIKSYIERDCDEED